MFDPSDNFGPDKLSPRQRALVGVYSATLNVVKACRYAKVPRQTHYAWMQRPAYRAAIEAARSVAGDILEGEAMRRAVEGADEPVFYRGRVVGSIRRHSDTLLIKMLSSVKPELYGERTRLEHTGKDGIPLEAVSVLIRKAEDERAVAVKDLGETLADDAIASGAPVTPPEPE